MPVYDVRIEAGSYAKLKTFNARVFGNDINDAFKTAYDKSGFGLGINGIGFGMTRLVGINEVNICNVNPQPQQVVVVQKPEKSGLPWHRIHWPWRTGPHH